MKSNEPRNKIQIDLLHSFHVEINGKQIIQGWNQRYAKQIIIYLLFHPTSTREELCERLWPEVSLELAKKNIRVYLYHLRKVINMDASQKPALEIDREHIVLNGEFYSDALTLVSEIRQAVNEENNYLKYKQVQNIFNKIDAPNYLTPIYDDWFLEIRERIENDLIDLLIWMGDWLIEHRELEPDKRFLQKLMTVFDGHEEIHATILKLQ